VSERPSAPERRARITARRDRESRPCYLVAAEVTRRPAHNPAPTNHPRHSGSSRCARRKYIGGAAPPYLKLVGRTCRSAVESRQQAQRRWRLWASERQRACELAEVQGGARFPNAPRTCRGAINHRRVCAHRCHDNAFCPPEGEPHLVTRHLPIRPCRIRACPSDSQVADLLQAADHHPTRSVCRLAAALAAAASQTPPRPLRLSFPRRAFAGSPDPGTIR
jgi:hypothetical protein